MTKLENLQRNPFLDGPAEFVVKTVARELATYNVWRKIFGSFIDPYKRMDYSYSSLPALRIYNDDFVKQFESWFIDGDLILDIIWPPALRRPELQQFPDTVASAILQHFRRPSFFDRVENAINEGSVEDDGFKTVGVPGLNELGKRITVDKGLAFELGENEYAPLTQINVNFRVDLREWDRYLETQDRTKDEPFLQTLADLEQLTGQIAGVDDDGIQRTDDNSVDTDQALT